MQTLKSVKQVLDLVAYKPNWEFDVYRDGKRDGGRLYLQATCSDAVDARTGEPTYWRTAKHYLSPYMCDQEIVGIAFKCIRDAEEHELREWFRYRGRTIYNAHINPEALCDMLGSHPNPIILRENSMTMEET